MKRVTIRVSFARRFASRLHDWAQLGDAKQRPYTHICDSVKRRLKADRTAGLQGEFGHRALELLDRRRRASDDFGRRGSAGPSDGHTQRRSGLFRLAQAYAARRGRDRSAHFATTRRRPHSLGREDPMVSRGRVARPHPPDRRAYQHCRSAGA